MNVTIFEENLKELQVLESKWGKMRVDLARKLFAYLEICLYLLPLWPDETTELSCFS